MKEPAFMPIEVEDEGAGAAERVAPPRPLSWLLPSLSDSLFVALIWLLFISGAGWETLLGDADTGMHIRTGDWILARHAVPVRDPFSFTAPETPWYAWEWLGDVAFASAHRLAGLKGVVLFSGVIICLAITILFRHMIWRGAGIPAAFLMSLLAADALRLHFLARPHIFTTLLAVVTLWMLDHDRAKPGRAIWLLVPIAALWVNLHGGFLVLIVALGAYTAAALLRRETSRVWRYGALTAACSIATLANPYGWRLHQHVWTYLRSDWLLKSIDEFQSPVFRSEQSFKFEILLFLGLVLLFQLVRSRRYADAVLIVFWAHAALTSVRHITIYVIVAAPPIAEYLGAAWDRWTGSSTRDSVKGVLRDLVRELLPHAVRTSIWVPVLLVLLAVSGSPNQWPKDFSSASFPTVLLARNAVLLDGPGHENARFLNPDMWGGYLIYRLYPSRHVFIDGRSDYYGPKVLKDYLCLRAACENWQELANRYRFQFALIPADWPLVGVLKHSTEWTLRDKDDRGLLFERERGLGPGY